VQTNIKIGMKRKAKTKRNVLEMSYNILKSNIIIVAVAPFITQGELTVFDTNLISIMLDLLFFFLMSHLPLPLNVIKYYTDLLVCNKCISRLGSKVEGSPSLVIGSDGYRYPNAVGVGQL
jgi:hypothetical protein